MRAFSWIATGLAAAVATPASASLGGGADTVLIDKARLHVTNHTIASTAGQTIHTMAMANGNIVREHVNPAGVVFAVAWRGRGRPDLAQLLGPHFAMYQSDTIQSRRHLRRMPPMIDRGDLKIFTGGHPGDFWGVAWLPPAAPAGFAPATP